MKKLVNITIITVILLLPVTGLCQGDSYSLLTERYIDRPLAMYRGQLQLNSGYEFSSLNKLYDINGNLLDLDEEGLASSKHLLPLEIKYGIMEWIQVRASMNYARKSLRNQNFMYYGYTTNSSVNVISHSEIETWQGFDDLFLGIDLTAPFLQEIMSWIVSGGIQLPVFNHEPDQPAHSIDFYNFYSDSTVIRYRYHNKFSNGIPVGKIGTALKLRFNKLAFELLFDFEKSLAEGESIYWQSRYSEGEIEYRKIPYQYDPGLTYIYRAAFAYQALNWFAVQLSYDGMTTFGGWSTENGKKAGTGNISLNSLGIGYEIQVSTHLRLNQFMDIPFSGKNLMAYWTFQTGISLNFMTGR